MSDDRLVPLIETADLSLRSHTRPDGWQQTAVFSSCQKFRYALTRMWMPLDDHDPDQVLVVIGLNPSTATEEVDDPTIRRCIDFARRWDKHGLVMLNLFALRSTDPRELYRALDRGEDIIGGKAQEAALDVLTEGRRVLCAWGAHGALNARSFEVAGRLHQLGRELVCLGRTKDGEPRHPLYLRADTTPEQYP